MENIQVGQGSHMTSHFFEDVLRLPAHWKREKEGADNARELLHTTWRILPVPLQVTYLMALSASEILRALATQP